MALVSFTLIMPGVGSWNGKWTGAGQLCARVRNVSAKTASKLEKYYSYSFGDGWRAGIEVSPVDAKEARRLRRETIGFAGYDWMIDSIVDYGDIRVPPKNT